MTELTTICVDNNLNFNYLDLSICTEILERELTNQHVINKNYLGASFCLFSSLFLAECFCCVYNY